MTSAEVALKCGYIVPAEGTRQDRSQPIRVAPVVIRYPELSVNIKRVKSGGTELLTGNHVYDVATTTRAGRTAREPFDGGVFVLHRGAGHPATSSSDRTGPCGFR